MLDKLYNFVADHPFFANVLMITLLSPIIMVVIVAFITYIVPNQSSTLEDVKDAQYVFYTSGGEMRAVEYSTIVDMENGYQYRIFEIDGQYVCAPAIDADGTVCKTVE